MRYQEAISWISQSVRCLGCHRPPAFIGHNPEAAELPRLCVHGDNCAKPSEFQEANIEFGAADSQSRVSNRM